MAGSLLLLNFIAVCSAPGSFGDPFDQIENKFYGFLTGDPLLDTDDFDIAAKIREINDSAKAYWDSMEKNPGRSYIWSSLPMDFSGENLPASVTFEMTNTFLRLSVMCQAYRTRGGELYDNKNMGNDILAAVIWMNENKYTPDGKAIGNWWDWQVGAPLRFIDCIVMMKDEIPHKHYQNCVNALLAHVGQGTPAPGDANSMWNLFIRLMIGTLDKNDAYIQKVIDGMNEIWFTYTTSRNGFYADGSYIMHDANPYTGSYGASAIESAAKLAYLVSGTKYDISESSKKQAVKWINESYSPVIYRGLMMDMVRGRAMSRLTEGDHLIGHVVIRSIYLFTLVIPEENAKPIRELIKYWIQSDTHRSIYSGKDVTNNNNYLFFIGKLKQLMNDPAVQPAEKPVFHKQFSAMARIVHSRPDYTFAISMHSDTIRNYESIHGENRRGWHMGSGMTYLYNGDTGQFSDDYWPTVDAYRLPGITVNRESTLPAHRPNGDSYAGGASIDGLYGIAGMFLKPYSQNLEAKKSWFMFDDEIAVLGSGINASDNRVVETVIENRKLKPDNSNTFTLDGKIISASVPTLVLSNPSWMHVSGNTENSEIGYFFPEPFNVQFVRSERSDSWYSVNSNSLMSLDELLNACYLTLYFDHGNNPENASCSSVILPNKSADEVKKYSESPGLVVLENSSDAHGVYHNRLRITGVNFWNDMVKKVSFITSDRKSSIIVKETDTEIFASVADPSNRNGNITVHLEYSAAGCLAKDDNITVIQLSPVIIFSVDVTGKNRLSSYISFRKGISEPD